MSCPYTDGVASDPPDKEHGREAQGEEGEGSIGEGGGGGGGGKSVFGFISPEPPDQPSKESGFSFINNSSATGQGGEGEGEAGNTKTGEVDSSLKTEGTVSSLKTQETPTGHPNPTPSGVIYSGNTPPRSRPTDPLQSTPFCTSSGVHSPVPGPISPPLVTSGEGGGGGGGGGGGERASVGKQQPIAVKKKKRRAVR